MGMLWRLSQTVLIVDVTKSHEKATLASCVLFSHSIGQIDCDLTGHGVEYGRVAL